MQPSFDEEITLHITNGDAAVGVMEKAGIEGEILPWRDVLHEGPTPADLTLDQMSEVRARFIADCGWATLDEALKGFRERDAKLAAFRKHEEVVLWFEHDLYDQLQLLQLLDWFSQQDLGRTALSMICVDDYLGTMSPSRLAALYPDRAVVTSEQLQLGRHAWRALCAADPMPWAQLTVTDTSALPYLAGAVIRHLEQYPSVQNGTNRTEGALLAAAADGISKPGRLFEATQQSEARRFMGDSTFWIYLNAMVESKPPLLRLADDGSFRLPDAYPYPPTFREQDILITDTGRSVLANALDWIEINGIDKWLGGVHLASGNIWRWDRSAGSLKKSKIHSG
jgi:hypothetical protein